jgi:hypothetical protein
MNTKFQVGDKVQIRKELTEKIYNDGLCFVYDMLQYRGKEAIIKRVRLVCGKVRYNLDIDGQHWYWSDDMLDEVKIEIKVGDIVRVTQNVGIYTEHDILTNQIAEVVEDSFNYPMENNGVIYNKVLRFLNPTIETKKREIQGFGVLLFADCELEHVNRVVEDEDEKIIVNYPATICILERDGKKYKGVAKVLDGDVFDMEKGKEIARTKAELKYLNEKLARLIK